MPGETHRMCPSLLWLVLVICFDLFLRIVHATAPIPRQAPLPIHYHGAQPRTSQELVADKEDHADSDSETPEEGDAMSRRSLAASAPTCPELHSGSSWGPLRIGYELTSLGGNANSASTQNFFKFLEDPLLKNSFGYWSRALSSRRYSTTSPIDRDAAMAACGIRGPAKRSLFVDNVDVYLFIEVDDTSICGTSTVGGTLAAASSCYIDQCGRPVAGAITLCTNSGYADLSVERNLHFNYANVIHEIAHVLFFFDLLWPNFVKDDGNLQITDRRYFNYDCYGRWDVPYNTGRRWWSGYFAKSPALPDGLVGTATYGNFEMSGCSCPYGSYSQHTSFSGSNFGKCLTDHPHCQFEIRSPKVVQKAREYFGCPTLAGVPLENTPTSRCSAMGNHWEQRILNNEMLAATGGPDDATFVSSISLAFAEDTGWFRADYSRATKLIENLHWGYLKGCPFVQDTCVKHSASVLPSPVSMDTFCANERDTGCAPTRTGRQLGFCSLVTDLSDLDPEYDYFPSSTTTGGGFEILDHCPRRFAYARGTGDCQSTNAHLSSVLFNARHSTSRCFHALATVTGSTATVFKSTNTLTGELDFVLPTCYRVDCGTDGYDVYGKLETGSRAEVKIARCDKSGNFVANSNSLSSSLKNTQILQCNSFDEMCNRVKSAHLYGGLHEDERNLANADSLYPVAPFYGSSSETCLGKRGSASECPTYCAHFFKDYCGTKSGMCVSSACKTCMDANSCTQRDCRQSKCSDVCPTCATATTDDCSTLYVWGYTPAYCPSACSTYYARFCSTDSGPGMCVDAACYECDTACVSKYLANIFFDIQTCWASCETCPSGSLCAGTAVASTPHFDPSWQSSTSTTAAPFSSTHNPTTPSSFDFSSSSSTTDPSSSSTSTTSSTTPSGGFSSPSSSAPTTTFDPKNVPTDCERIYALDAVPYPKCPDACESHYADFCQPLDGPGMCVAATCKFCDQKCMHDAIAGSWTSQRYQDCYQACDTCPHWGTYCSSTALAAVTIITKADIDALMTAGSVTQNNSSRPDSRSASAASSTSTTTTTPLPASSGASGSGSSATPTWRDCDLDCPSVSGSLALTMARSITTTDSTALTTLLSPSIGKALAATLGVEKGQVNIINVRITGTSGGSRMRRRAGAQERLEGESSSGSLATSTIGENDPGENAPVSVTIHGTSLDKTNRSVFKGPEPPMNRLRLSGFARPLIALDGDADEDHNIVDAADHEHSRVSVIDPYTSSSHHTVFHRASRSFPDGDQLDIRRDDIHPNERTLGNDPATGVAIVTTVIRDGQTHHNKDTAHRHKARVPSAEGGDVHHDDHQLDGHQNDIKQTETTSSNNGWQPAFSFGTGGYSSSWSSTYADRHGHDDHHHDDHHHLRRKTEEALALPPGRDVTASRDVPSLQQATHSSAQARAQKVLRKLETTSGNKLEAIYEVRVATNGAADSLLSTLYTVPGTTMTSNLQTELVSSLGASYSVSAVSEGSVAPMTYHPPTSSSASHGSQQSGQGNEGTQVSAVDQSLPTGGNLQPTTIQLDLYDGATSAAKRTRTVTPGWILTFISFFLMSCISTVFGPEAPTVFAHRMMRSW
ncbi:unnamed protein product [Amoebophrya sp. A25]|nr:unnamed protein product [Amoebophrya sp. A25]|eukprot:GSA25T00014342001.1